MIGATYGQFGVADTVLVLGTDYDVDLVSEPARIHFYTTVPWYNCDHISVSYVAGYGATAATIPAAIQNACLIATTYLYNNRGGSDSDMPEAFFALLSPYRMTTFPSTT